MYQAPLAESLTSRFNRIRLLEKGSSRDLDCAPASFPAAASFRIADES